MYEVSVCLTCSSHIEVTYSVPLHWEGDSGSLGAQSLGRGSVFPHWMGRDEVDEVVVLVAGVLAVFSVGYCVAHASGIGHAAGKAWAAGKPQWQASKYETRHMLNATTSRRP
jgi:hypothetical protein